MCHRLGIHHAPSSSSCYVELLHAAAPCSLPSLLAGNLNITEFLAQIAVEAGPGDA